MAPRLYPHELLMRLNSKGHCVALTAFIAIVLAHWVEHITQAIQIYALGWPVHHAGGALGLAFPWLVHTEWLHYGYALVMLIGLVALRPAFLGSAGLWWLAALVIQVWHHCEHLLLLTQALSGHNLAGRAVPTSIAQLLFPRVELHLFYNTIVFVPMVIAIALHWRPADAERKAARCSCPYALTGQRQEEGRYKAGTAARRAMMWTCNAMMLGALLFIGLFIGVAFMQLVSNASEQAVLLLALSSAVTLGGFLLLMRELRNGSRLNR
ncbi:hypothetical protein [Streptomyces sp. NPDC042319]|uniref:hypothetical protein n=1 Tax=Streptomyces sp. NPDC042319 TaxID=3154332 RepID=UPI00340D137B